MISVSEGQLIYWDNHSTTPLAKEVFDAMEPYLKEFFANPSSGHQPGLHVRRAIENARQTVAMLLGAAAEQIIFTSGGTESNNLAIRSALHNPHPQHAIHHRPHLITTRVEHSSVRALAQTLEREGATKHHVTWLGVHADGTFNLDALDQAITRQTTLVSIMWANNETGVLFPIEKIAAICHQKKIPLHVDAVQIFGKQPINLARLPIDYLSISGHKLHGPKGIGVLFARNPEALHPLILGGHQEQNHRGGTENVPGIVGLAVAARIAYECMQTDAAYTQSLRDFFESEILRIIPHVTINGHPTERLGHTTNLSFAGISSETLLLALDQRGVCASSASACTTGSVAPSYVLLAMGLPPDRALNSIRFSFSRYNTREEIERVLSWLPQLVVDLRAKSPMKEF